MFHFPHICSGYSLYFLRLQRDLLRRPVPLEMVHETPWTRDSSSRHPLLLPPIRSAASSTRSRSTYMAPGHCSTEFPNLRDEAVYQLCAILEGEQGAGGK